MSIWSSTCVILALEYISRKAVEGLGATSGGGGGPGKLQPLAPPPQNLGVHLTLFQPGEHIMPTTLLLAHPDFKT